MAMDFDYYFDVMYDTGPLPLRKDPSYTTTGTCLLEAMKLIDEVEKTLLMKKKDFKMKLKILKFKMNIVENKQTQLKETMVKFNKFVQENDYKRLRAEAKIEGERQTINALTQDINTAQGQLIELGNFKKKLLNWTKEKQIYFDFMQQVHQRTTYDFPELRHIIARKETLLAIQEELVSRISTGMDGCETVKNALKKYVEDQHLVFIHLNLELTSQKEKREKIKQSIYDYNNQQNELASKILARAADLKKIMLCLSNIWEHMQMFESQQSVPKPATLGLCISFVPVIVKFLLFLNSVVARIKKDLASLPPPLPPCE